VVVPVADETLCSVCDARLPASARFCPACGSPLVAAGVVEVRKTVTLLFCDVTGSTALGERLDPEAFRGVMSRYFAVARVAVQRHGGTVEKFVGDAVLAVFGIPEVREDDALRAVRAAAELRDCLADLSGELMGSMGIGLAVRTGVNTGSVVAGSAHAGGSFATGDAVNTAARLEQAAAPGEVLIGASTWWLVRDAVEVEAVAPLAAKGKAEPLAAYRLLRVLEAERGRSRRPGAALVGRERESHALAEALARTTEGGRGQLVTVLGPAGMGKTRLVEHFLAGIGQDVQVLRGRCVSYGRGITFWPFVQLLRQGAGLIGEETPEATEKALLALMDASPDKGAVVAVLLPLLGLGGEPGGAEEIFWAVRSVLEHLAGHGPLVVAVEDIHWAEPTLLDLLERLRDEARDVPLLIVCQARPELLEQRPGWGGGALNVTTFLLEPLTGGHTAALLGGLLGPGVPGRVVAAVEGWAGGNPLFVEEVAAHLVETDVLRRDHDGWVVVGDLRRVSVPPTVTALLAARLERITRPERALLERVSVIGLEVTTADAAALSADDLDVPALLASLSRRDLLRRVRGLRADVWAFRHVLLRDAAYESLPKSVRAELHERFAVRLQESATDAGGEIHAFVGHHLEQAYLFARDLSPNGDAVAALARRAAIALAAAGAHARDTDDLPAAGELLGRAVALTPQGGAARRDLLWHLAQLQQDQGHVTEAEQSLQRVAELMDDGTPALERSSYMAQVLSLRCEAAEDIDPAELQSAAVEAARLARQHHDHERLTQALNAGVSAATMQGRWGDAAQMLREIQRVGPPHDRREARIWVVAAYIWGPAPVEEGLAYVATVRDQPGQTLRSTAINQACEGALLAAAGRIEPALDLARESTHIARDLDPLAFAPVAEFRALVHLARGDLDEALRKFTEASEVMREHGDLSYASTMLGWKAALLLEQGNHDDQARQVLEEAAAVTSPYDRLSVGLVETCLALLAARNGDHEQAAARASTALTTIDASDQICQQADIRRWLSEVPRLRGEVAQQRRLLVEARDLYRAKGHLPLLAVTERLLSQITS
jgi:class 3 adenylate cyclase/tetratricopeptide (TPR) repeat protein